MPFGLIFDGCWGDPREQAGWIVDVQDTVAGGWGVVEATSPPPAFFIRFAMPRVITIYPFGLATAASAMLAWHHLSGHYLPGCGVHSACASLAASPWGNILGIPLSILGVAYFAAITVAVTATKNTPTLTGATIPRLILFGGAVMSVFYIGLMAWLGRWCGYCLVVHGCNLLGTSLLIADAWRSRTRLPEGEPNAPARRLAGTCLAVFSIVLIGLLVADRQMVRSASRQQAEQLDESVQRVVDSQEPKTDRLARGFSGRHVSGTQPTAVRLVLFMDYQCGDCREVEQEIAALQDEGVSIAVSLRQFPLCSECNPSIPYPWFHPRACDAARLAEAMALVGGEDAFAATHRWLFERKAKFQPADVDELCQSLGISSKDVQAAISSPRVKQILYQDISEGITLGITETPFVYLNGIEQKGIAAEPSKIRSAIERVLAEDQRRLAEGEPTLAGSFEDDPRPPAAEDRILDLWQTAETAEQMPDRGAELIQLGNADGAHRIVLFQEPTYADGGSMWKALTELATLRNDVSIEFYLYPMNPTDNSDLADWQQNLYPRSAIASRLIGALVTEDRIDRIETVFEVAKQNKDNPDQAAFEQAFAERMATLESGSGTLEKSVEQWQRRVMKAEVLDLIRAQFAIAQKAGVSWGPTLMIDGHLSPTDRISAPLLNRLLDAPPPAAK